MAGHGFAPKDPARKLGHSKDTTPTTSLRPDVASPPALPEPYDSDPHVLRWWGVWKASPQSEHFTSTDWDFLLDTVPMVAAYWGGNMKVAPEIRLRVAKFGATPEDRARLRWFFDAKPEDVPAPNGDEVSRQRDRKTRLAS